jgi:hypothetical protein
LADPTSAPGESESFLAPAGRSRVIHVLTWRARVLVVMPTAALALFLAADVVLRANLRHNEVFLEVAFTAFAVASAIAGAVIVVR